jgi:hydroxyacylglutathione hydrolase
MTYEGITGGFVMTNAWLLSHGGRHILFDAPEDSAEWLRRLGIKLDALVLTHQHFDHVMEAAEIVRDHGCPVYAYAPPSPDLWLSRVFQIEIEPFPVTHILKDQETCELIGQTFSVRHVPGHSPDSLCFYHADSELCICGDTIIPGACGRTDFPGGSTAQLFAGIKRHLYSLPDTTRLLPGHNDEVLLGEEKQTNTVLAPLLSASGDLDLSE